MLLQESVANTGLELSWLPKSIKINFMAIPGESFQVVDTELRIPNGKGENFCSNQTRMSTID